MICDYEARFRAALFGAYVAYVRARQAAGEPVLPSPVGRPLGVPGSGAPELLGLPARAASKALAGNGANASGRRPDDVK